MTLKLQVLFYRVLFALGVLAFTPARVSAEPMIIDLGGVESDPAAFSLLLEGAELTGLEDFRHADDAIRRAVYALRTLRLPAAFQIETRLNQAREIFHDRDFSPEETRRASLATLTQGALLMIRDLRRGGQFGDDLGAVIRQIKFAQIVLQSVEQVIDLRIADLILDQTVVLMQRLPSERAIQRAHSSVEVAGIVVNQGMMAPKRRARQALLDLDEALEALRRSEHYRELNEGEIFPLLARP